VAIDCEVVGGWGFAPMGGGNDGKALSRSCPPSEVDLVVKGSFPAITIFLLSGDGGATGSENDLE
jgi:hypothetical protein